MKQIIKLALGLILGVSATYAHDDAFQPKFVDTLVGPYLAIQKGLAGDDLKTAQTGANSFLDAMKNAPQEGEAKEESADLSNPADAIAKASDLKTARTAFLDLSHEMIPLVQHVGITTNTKLFVMHCPMALEHQGGDWIQMDKNVVNPYMGAKMLHCGSIQKQIAGVSVSPEGHSDHDEDHEHNADHHDI